MKLPLHVLSLGDDVRDAELVQVTLAVRGITCEIRRVETQTDFVAALDKGGCPRGAPLGQCQHAPGRRLRVRLADSGELLKP